MAVERPDWEWYRRASELVSAGDLETAERVIEDALEAGHLWRASLLLTPTLDPLRGRREFERLAAEARRRVDARNLQPLVLTATPSSTRSLSPLLLVLHGATGNAQTELERWRAATELGYTVCAAQSSQPATDDGYCWDPPRERVWKDLRAIAGMLPAHGRVVLAGFSQGAWVAINAALMADIIVAGTVVMIAPFAIRDSPLLPAWRRLRVSILIGERDQYREPVEWLARELAAHDHHTTLEVVPHLGHAYPDDFEKRLRALLRP